MGCGGIYPSVILYYKRQGAVVVLSVPETGVRAIEKYDLKNIFPESGPPPDVWYKIYINNSRGTKEERK